MLTNCLAEYAHLTITVSETERYIGKTRMVWQHDGEKISKISLFVLAQLTNVTDGRTDTR